jgi:hypothetical protein
VFLKAQFFNSPLLFDIFINGLLEELDKSGLGVEVRPLTWRIVEEVEVPIQP